MMYLLLLIGTFLYVTLGLAFLVSLCFPKKKPEIEIVYLYTMFGRWAMAIRRSDGILQIIQEQCDE